MAMFDGDDLTGSRFRNVDLTDSRFDGVLVRNSRWRGAELMNVDISGELLNVTINGVDVAPMIEAELDRRDPNRAAMRPTDPDGFRHAWQVLESLWSDTLERARALPPHLLHESVDDEWSFIQTLRHVAFASESWVGRGLLGDPAPWHDLSLPWDAAPAAFALPHDRDARPSLEDTLALRFAGADLVRQYLDHLTGPQLAGEVTVPDGPGWPPPGHTYPVREVLLTVLNEEWHHRLYAERDLAVLLARTGTTSAER